MSCEAVISEASFLLARDGHRRAVVLELVERLGVELVPLGGEIRALRQLTDRYATIPHVLRRRLPGSPRGARRRRRRHRPATDLLYRTSSRRWRRCSCGSPATLRSWPKAVSDRARSSSRPSSARFSAVIPDGRAPPRWQAGAVEPAPRLHHPWPSTELGGTDPVAAMRRLRRSAFREKPPLSAHLLELAAQAPNHDFLTNPAAHQIVRQPGALRRPGRSASGSPSPARRRGCSTGAAARGTSRRSSRSRASRR